MKKLLIVVSVLTCMGGAAVAGSIDSPGTPSAGSGMYSLKQIYDYLTAGTAATISGSFQDPTAGPGSTMYTTKQVYEAVATPFPQCDATTADVKSGKKFFCTVGGSWGVQTGTMASVAGGLLKTGQTSVYATGDDGYYQKGISFSYSWDVGTDTVKDNVTGLIWASNGTGAGCKNGGTTVWASALAWAEGLTFAGYSDWRLPNVTELQTLFVRDAGQSEPYVNQTMFPNTSYSYMYWSSTTYPGGSSYAMNAYFNALTQASSASKTTRLLVRAVRGGN